MSVDSETVEIRHEYIVDAGFSRRVARAFCAFTLRRPRMIVVGVLLAVFGVFLVVFGLWIENPVFTAFGVVYLAFIPGYALIIYRQTLHGNSRRLPPGSRIAVGLGEASMRTEGPLGSSIVSYRAYRSVHLSGDVVIVRHQGIRVYSLFPVELFPGSDLTMLRTAVAQANS